MARMTCQPPPRLDFERNVPGHRWRCEVARPMPNTWVARLLHNGEVVREATCHGADAMLLVTRQWFDALIVNADAPNLT